MWLLIIMKVICVIKMWNDSNNEMTNGNEMIM